MKDPYTFWLASAIPRRRNRNMLTGGAKNSRYSILDSGMTHSSESSGRSKWFEKDFRVNLQLSAREAACCTWLVGRPSLRGSAQVWWRWTILDDLGDLGDLDGQHERRHLDVDSDVVRVRLCDSFDNDGLVQTSACSSTND